jgi:hypothetical protein
MSVAEEVSSVELNAAPENKYLSTVITGFVPVI